MNKYALLLFIITLSAFGAFCAEPADSVFEADPYFILMGEADEAISDKNWDTAAARLCDALSIRPEHPSNTLLLNNLAKVYACMGQDSLALATYDRGLEIAPNMLTLVLGRGRTLLAQNRDNEAYTDFAHAIEIDSLSTYARFLHGMMSIYRGQIDAAEADFTVLSSLAGQSLDTAIALATLYSLTNRERLAIPFLERIIQHDPSPEYFASLAGCYLAIGELSDASRVISDGLKHYPADPELFYYRAWLNRDRYRLEDARKDGERAVVLGANPRRVAELFNTK